jgi:hypothetical protein
LLLAVPEGCFDLRTPREVRSSAFGVPVEPRASDFLLLMRMFTQAATPNEFSLLVSRAPAVSKQMPTPNWLRSQAEKASAGFRVGVAEGAALMRETTERSLVEHGITGKDVGKLRQNWVAYLRQVGDLKRYVLLAVASVAGVCRPQPNSGLWDWAVAEYERLTSIYNGSIDVYLDAYEHYIEKTWSGENAGRNDSFDLDHLVYLRPRDNSQIFVTDDRRLQALAARSLPNRILDLPGFRRVTG